MGRIIAETGARAGVPRTDADGRVRWTRPICAYPKQARHKSGDAKQDASYACE